MAYDLKRKLIVNGLVKVENSGFSNLVLSSLFNGNNLSAQDKAFISKVFYGTIEKKTTLNYILQIFISKPLKKLDTEVLAIMQSGLYQILYMNSVPRHAAINQAVNLCSSFKKTSAKGLVNAVLRKAADYEIKSAEFASETERISVTYSISEEITAIIMRDYPEDYETIISSMSATPALNININTTKISATDFRLLLDKNGIGYTETPLENCIELSSSGAVTDLPGFDEGYFFVQGITSRYAVSAAGIKSGDNVLDLCAAPGGKTFAAGIYLDNTGSITSCDPNPSRLVLIENGAKRLGFENITTYENYGQNFREDFVGKDIIICDVPCSGIGIIPKKPDLRYKKMDDLEGLCKVQQEILQTASRYVKTGGRIVYSTCTINKAENQQQIKKFLAGNDSFRLVEQDCRIKGSINSDNMVTFLPSESNCDGFFIAVLEKVW
ncbi:MAG: 16S rRNA (cytosine(967)-C(5))-methyltransferase RsmB [Oscillospiraceae bacterium]|nr:16S rRNA (cytosine(967)-C(5))-methyltransferase RsmB [Oscillospiraceae bacterium]